MSQKDNLKNRFHTYSFTMQVIWVVKNLKLLNSIQKKKIRYCISLKTLKENCTIFDKLFINNQVIIFFSTEDYNVHRSSILIKAHISKMVNVGNEKNLYSTSPYLKKHMLCGFRKLQWRTIKGEVQHSKEDTDISQIKTPLHSNQYLDSTEWKHSLPFSKIYIQENKKKKTVAHFK